MRLLLVSTLIVGALAASPLQATADHSAAAAPVALADGAASVPFGWTHSTRDALLAAADRPGDAFDDLLLARALRAVAMAAGDAHAPSPDAAALIAAAEALERRGVATATGDWRAMALLLGGGTALTFDATAIADALAAAQPHNGYAHLVIVAHAWRAGPPERFLDAVDQAARATGFRAVFPLAADALRRRIGRVDLETAVLSTSIAAAVALPAYQDVVAPCREATGSLADRCLAFGQLIVREGDTVIDVGIGAALVEALGSPEHRAEAIVRRDAARALFDAALPSMAAMEQDAAAFVQWQAIAAESGEVEGLRRWLAARGIPAPAASD